jgi:hypothetical protein
MKGFFMPLCCYLGLVLDLAGKALVSGCLLPEDDLTTDG